MEKLRILLADDHAVLRDGLAMLIDGESDMSVTAQAENGRDAVRLAREDPPDVAVVDVSMPLMNGAEVAEALREQGVDAVQATVSRDLTQLGLVKVRNTDGRLVYALPGSADLRRLDELSGALRRWAGGFTPAGNLCVIQTPRGFAAALADVIDAADLPEIAGTIAGDNTVFVAARDGHTGGEVAEELRGRLE